MTYKRIIRATAAFALAAGLAEVSMAGDAAKDVAAVVSHSRIAVIREPSSDRVQQCESLPKLCEGEPCPTSEDSRELHTRDPDCPVWRDGGVELGGLVEAEEPGGMTVHVLLDPPRSFELAAGTRAVVRGTLQRPSLILALGTIRWIGPDGQILTDAVEASGVNTDFTVSRDPAGLSEVFSISGRVVVRDPAGALLGELAAGDRLEIKKGGKAKIVRGQNAAPYVRKFELIGGGHLQSQTIENPLLVGSVVLPPEKAPLSIPKWRDPGRDRGRDWPEQPIFFDVLVDF